MLYLNALILMQITALKNINKQEYSKNHNELSAYHQQGKG